MNEMKYFYKCQKCGKAAPVEVVPKECFNKECKGEMKFAFIGFVEVKNESFNK